MHTRPRNRPVSLRLKGKCTQDGVLPAMTLAIYHKPLHSNHQSVRLLKGYCAPSLHNGDAKRLASCRSSNATRSGSPEACRTSPTLGMAGQPLQAKHRQGDTPPHRC